MIDTLFLGNCLDILRDLPDNSLDALVSDPPAGVGFMSEKWDTPDYFPLQDRGERLTGSGNPTTSRGFASGITFNDSKKGRDAFISFMTEVFTEVLRVLKPGASGLVWALPRTSHWTAMALEDAGFEIRDCVYHHFGSGYPKSHNVSKAIDKYLGKEREVIGQGKYAARKPHTYSGGTSLQISKNDTRIGHPLTMPASPEAEQWDGWGTALKPSTECWWLIRKPLSEKTVAAQMLATGTGALNIDACRVSSQDRWPSHLLLSHSIFCVDGECDESCPISLIEQQGNASCFFQQFHPLDEIAIPFLYCAKSSSTERNQGCDNLPERIATVGDRRPSGDFTQRLHPELQYEPKPRKNTHPTPKSIRLMSWLCRLITPPGGTILDPFCGSGSTCVAAIHEGFHFLGMEQSPEYFAIAQARIAYAQSSLR